MTTKKADPRLSRLVKCAKMAGASRAEVIDVNDVVVDRRVRLKCAVPLCDSYGRHLMCPPAVMPVDEFERALRQYRRALILQIETDHGSADEPGMRLTKETCSEREAATKTRDWKIRLHEVVNRVEAAAFKEGFYLAAGLIAGTCSLCKECVGQQSDRQCRHPFQARPSMEAMGIDVLRTCRNAGLIIRLSSEEKVRWTGLVLID